MPRRTRKQKEERERIARKRKDPVSRELERAADAEARRLARQNPNRRETEQAADTEARRIARANPQRRESEQAADTEAHRLARQNPKRRETEQAANTEAHRIARANPQHRESEQAADTEAHRLARQNPKRRETEQAANTEARRIARRNLIRRASEQESDTVARRKVRLNPNSSTPEKIRNTEARKIARQDPAKRTPEKQRDAEARRESRKNPVRRLAMQALEVESHQKRRRVDNSNYEKILQKYNAKIRCAPSYVCSCCGGLFYQESTSIISENILSAQGCSQELIKSVLHVSQNPHRLCSTCKASVKQKRIPRLSLSNGFDFPIISSELKDLSPLEERLVALRLPFMQIRLLGSERQSTLRGNVVNVENDLDVCAEVLPRRFDETSTVQVQLMRRMAYKSPYMYETIRPQKVYRAAKYLINSELYKSENVILSEDWSSYKDDECMNFVCSDNESPDNVQQADNTSSIKISFADVHNFGAEETLIFRENDFRGIRIAPGEGKIPISLHRDENAEVLSFPTIYGGVRRKFKDNMKKVSYTDIAKSELRRYDRRACNPTKILYSFKKSFNEKVFQAVQICMRKKVGSNRITAKIVKSPGYIDNLLKTDQGYAVFKNLRSSPSYWKEKTKKVIAMVRQIGKCTFFITLSAAETKWLELIVMLMKIVKNEDVTEDEASNMSFDDIADLIRRDPVTCMRHFDHKFRALLNLLLKPEGGIFAPYKLKDYFSRLEFQMRGSPHAHGLYWIPEAPVYMEGNEDSEKQCIEFVDKFITCSRNEEGEMEKLIGYQINKHSQTCKKLNRNRKCRFGFPKPPMAETMILKPLPKELDSKLRKQSIELYSRIQDVLDSMGRGFKEDVNYSDILVSINTTHENYIDAIRSSIKRTTVFLKRSTNAIFVNPYNQNLLKAWRANIDIQFVLDTYACAKYCVGYILKSDGGISKLLQDATIDVRNGNSTIQCKLKKYANILINGTEISAQEAVSFLLGIPNTICSRQDVFINTAHPDERIGFLKSQDELNKLLDDSKDICMKGLLDHYSNRPEELENTCLAEFASMYEFTKNKSTGRGATADVDEVDEETENAGSSVPLPPDSGKILFLRDSSGYLRKRNVRKVIRFRHYGKLEDDINYNREQLMLFLPWRDESRELLTIDPIQKAEEYKSILFENSQPYYWNRDVDDRALNAVVNELDDMDIEPDSQLVEDVGSFDFEEVNQTDFLKDVGAGSCRVEQFLPPRLINEEEYVKVMRTLNEKQRKFVLNILHFVKTFEKPFHIFLSGGAGVGKSHAITAIVQSYLRFNSKVPSVNPEQICVLVSAPTGKAAFNVFGMTLHCTFKLPPTQYGGKVCDLDDGAVNTLRVKFAKTKIFIIDEISMVSVKQFFDIDQRLKQIFSTTEDFGGRSIIVVGHLRQLPPVCGTYVFKAPNHLPLGECVGNFLWEKFTIYELDEIMRQRGELEFCKALNNMSEGCMDSDDIALMKSREVSSTNVPPQNAIRLFRTNAECQEYNSKVHSSLKTDSALCIAIDTIQGSASSSQKQRDDLMEYAMTLTPQQSDGLPYKTNLQGGGEYFVSTNVDVQDGLFNGSTGCLKKIEYGTHIKTNTTRPKFAWMDFRNPLIGINTRSIKINHMKNKDISIDWVPIGRETRNLSKTGRHGGLQIIRNQIPLIAANGMTIAKSQGSSIPIVVVNVKRFHGRKLSRELLYVACSRSTSRNGLYIDGEFEAPERPGPNDPVSLEMERLRKIPCLLPLRFLQDYDGNFEKLHFHNVQSFVAHHLDVIADQCAMRSDFLAFVEPHLQTADNFAVPNYNVLYRSNCRDIRNSEGALVMNSRDTVIDRSFVVGTKHFSPSGHCLFVKWKTGNVTVLMTYKSPKYSSTFFVQRLAETLQNTAGHIVVVGDININLQKSEGNPFLTTMNDFNLQSKLKLEDPTTDGGTHIDCCFSNVEHLQAWLYESYYSYHKPICAVWPKSM